jgi:aspartyl-tRNA(Asn)/glutamyl-tRNA(Gln) amidotransferase subunit A
MPSALSLPVVQGGLLSGSTSLPVLLDKYLDKVRSSKDINAFISVFDEQAARHAEHIQSKIESGTYGKLAGLVLAVKDNICIGDQPVTAGSRMLEHFRSVYDATVIRRLVDEDALIIGKTNCDEFAMGGTNETSAFGPVLNPFNKNKVAGGSSGGSAAAVAAGLCHAALGSDTGGSIRQPASFCGVVGLKPTYGRVSRYGLIAYGSSLDQIGPITANIEDAALLLEVIAGYDPHDSTSADREVPEYSRLLQKDHKKTRVAFLKETLDHPGLDAEIRQRIQEIIEALHREGHTVDPVPFPYLDYLVPAYYIMATAEASSNLARYDGMQFGRRSNKRSSLRETMIASRSEGFGREVKRRIMTGSFVLSAGYYEAYYAKAQKARRLILDKTREILDSYDVILLPTTPRTAFDLGTMGDDPVALYLEDIFTIHANLAGIPAISLPLGMHSNGMPFGIQVMGNHFREEDLLSFAAYLYDNHHQ